MALIQLCQARGAGAEEFCFVDLGHQFTRITVVWRDRVQATRQIALGGRNLDMIVAGELGVDPFLSNTYKATNFQDVLTLPAVAEVCERIAVEILKVINFYQFTYRSSSLEGVYLVGGGAALPLLRQSIESAVGLRPWRCMCCLRWCASWGLANSWFTTSGWKPPRPSRPWPQQSGSGTASCWS